MATVKLVKLYKEDRVCKAEKSQVKDMLKGGWKKEAPQTKEKATSKKS